MAVPSDLDADGWIDLVVDVAPEDGWGSLRMLWNDGDGALRFAARDTLARTDWSNHAWMSILAADWDGNDQIDLLSIGVVDDNSTWIVDVRGTGGRHFENAPTLLLGRRASRDDVRVLASADFDNDGRPDILAYRTLGPGDKTLSVLRHATRDAFRCFGRYDAPAPIVPQAARGRVHAVELGGSGRLELLEQGSEGLLFWSFDDRGRRLGPVDVAASGTLEKTLDLNGDGRSDVLMSRGSELDVLLASARLNMMPAGTWSDAQLVATGDFDGNHATDIAVSNAHGRMTLLMNDGKASFTPVAMQLSVESGWNAPAAGDLNGDGRDDVAFHSRAEPDSLHVLLNEGEGRFGAPQSFALSRNLLTGAEIVIRDLDDDGLSDVAVLGEKSGVAGVLDIFVNTGGGGLIYQRSLGTHELPRSLMAEDLNRDGRIDLAYVSSQDANDARLTVYYGAPGNVWLREEWRIDNGVANSLATGDINGDSKIDVVVNTGGTGAPRSLAVLFNVTADGSTATVVSLASARFENGVVRLRWLVSDEHVAATVERRDNTLWHDIGVPEDLDGSIVEYRDRFITRGERYAYRLRVNVGVTPTYSDVVEIEIPGSRLAIEALIPNPSAGEVTVRLATPTGSALRLEVFDIGGRRVHEQNVSGAPGGARLVPLTPHHRLSPGVYLVRIEQAGSAAVARLAIVR